MNRRLFLCALIACCAGCFRQAAVVPKPISKAEPAEASAAASASPEPSTAESTTSDRMQPKQWRVLWKTDPATEAVISWNTDKPGARHEVRYGVKAQSERAVAACTRNGRYSGDGELYFHHAELMGLVPETAYEIEIRSDGATSPKLYFVTAPREDRPFTIIYGGDSRTDRRARRKVNRMIGSLFGKAARGDTAGEILAMAHGGDYVATGKSLSQWSDWMTDYGLTTAGDGRLLPLIPARGNHDHGPLYDEIFNFPQGDGDYFAVEIGPRLLLITLNTETEIAGRQTEWLTRRLEASRPKYRWVIAQYHKPAFPAVKKPSDALAHWVPLFERHNLDLACEADGHCIKRTLPIRGGKHDETGVVYIGEGGLGVPPRTPDATRWFVQKPGMVAQGHHVQLLTFTEDELQYQCVLLGEKVLDTYRRRPRK